MGGSRLDMSSPTDASAFASGKKGPKALSSSEVGPQAPNASFRRRLWFSLALILVCMNLARWLSFFKVSPAPVLPDLYEASIRDLQAGLDAGHFSSVHLVQAYFSRIEEVNIKGPGLRAVIELNPSALKVAALLDLERRYTGKRSELHGIPILLKDNFATVAAEGMNTTAGSFSLLGSIVSEDAGVVKKASQGGCYNLRDISGWSGRGGQGTGAYYPRAHPCGSSSGSAVAASIGLTPVALGTETDGSITCPSSNNNLAGIKPTVGWTSRAGVIPISANQDTVGPMARSMTDAAIVLSIIAGPDPNDNFTLAQPPVVPDFTTALNKDAFKGKRIGVPRRLFLNESILHMDPSLVTAFEGALETMKKTGCDHRGPGGFVNEKTVLHTDLKVYLNQYFETLLENPSGVRNLADLIKFNNENPELETPEGYEDQSVFIISEATNGFDTEYWAALAANHDIGRTRGIDHALKEHNLDALVLPGPGYTPRPAAIAGYPIVTVPLGFYPENVTIGEMQEMVYPAPGIPFGLSFLGTAYSDFELIGLGFAYEQATQTRLARRAFPAAIPKTQLKDVIGK
ncbi:Amidase signature enzyme [Mycena venus]|uniref:Amidase signature enzyme n=1 Tax=Mycena venus TaxID=2733690 RepID=A0A8H6Y9C7_9AGAR|nr:Amidase signature enzyme [Mycena venus]